MRKLFCLLGGLAACFLPLSASAETPPSPTPAPQAAGPDSFTAVVIVLGLCLLALLLLWSRRNSLYKNIGMKVDESVGRVESYTAKNPALVPVDDGRPRPPLLCYRLPGAQEPKTLELDQTLLIGKGAVCLPQLPPSVQGVDPVHCRLRWRDGVTTLEDLGSQTGTFLENGEQLAPFAPAVLPEGQGFTAGSFRFELLPPPPKEA